MPRYAVHIQELHIVGTGAQSLVIAANPLAAVTVAMHDEDKRIPAGRCWVRVYDAANDSYHPPGPILLECYAELDVRTGKITIETPTQLDLCRQLTADLKQGLQLLATIHQDNKPASEAIADADGYVGQVVTCLGDVY